MSAGRTICHIDPESGFSGGEVQVFLLMEGLRERGFRNLLVCRAETPIEQTAKERGFEAFRASMRSDLSLASVARVRRVLVNERADIVHLHTGRATWLGGLAAAWAGVPALTTRRMERRVKRNARNRWIYGRLVERAVAISGPVADCLRAGGVPEEKIRVIYSSIDPRNLKVERSADAVRTELDIAPERNLLVMLASIVPRKGIDVLLNAMSRMNEDALLVVAGTEPEASAGATRAKLEQQAQSLGLADRLRFIGRFDHAADLLNAATLFLLPSRQEGLGVSALEAMACGRAVVATNVGGLGEAMVNEETGLVVPPDDPAALAVAVDRLLVDRELRARCEAGGPARVRERYLSDTMVDSYAALYEEMLSAHE